MTFNEPEAKIQTITTVQQLSDYLGVTEKALRRWLREDYPDHAPGKGGRWPLTPAMNRRMAERSRGSRL